MRTINAIVEPDADGTLHLPLPVELRCGKVRVVATVDHVPADSGDASEAGRQRRLLAVMERIRARNPFGGIMDPVAREHDIREDVTLPGCD